MPHYFTKYSLFLMWFLCLPVMLYMDNLLSLWLKEVPDYTKMFSFIILSGSIFYQMYRGIEITIHADGRIKWFSLISSFIHIIIIPIDYVLLKLGWSMEGVLIISTLWTLLNMMTVSYFVQRFTGYTIFMFFKDIFVPMTLLFLVSSITCYSILVIFDVGVPSFLWSYICNAFAIILIYYFFVMDKKEKEVAKNMISMIISKIHTKKVH